MTDIQKVIEDLNIAKNILVFQQMLNPEMHIKIGSAISAAIDILKEREAVKPIYNEEKYGDHLPHCGNCEKVLPNNAMYGQVNFCHYCGKQVK